MKLFTKQIDKLLFHQYQFGNDLQKQVVVAKIFNPYGRGVWYLLNSDPKDPDYIWAIVDLLEVEVGSVSRSDLESMKVPPFGLRLERDAYFTPKPAAEVFEGAMRGIRYAQGGSIEEYAKGGRIKMVKKEDAWMMSPARFLEKDVLNRVMGQIETLKYAGNLKIADWNSDVYFYHLDEYDRKLLEGKIDLKPHERVYRYFTYITAASGAVPLLKINQENGLVYTAIFDSNDEFIGFERKGLKTEYITFVEVQEDDYYANGGYLRNGKMSYEVGDEGMYQGGEARITKVTPTSYEYSYIKEDGSLDYKRNIEPKERFEEVFALFPKMQDGGVVKNRGDYVRYKDETYWITDRNGVVGLALAQQGAWGGDAPFTPLSKIDISEVTDYYGNKVQIPSVLKPKIVEDGGKMADGGLMAKGGKVKKDFKVGDKVVYAYDGKFFVRNRENYKRGEITKIEEVGALKIKNYTIESRNKFGHLLETYTTTNLKEIELDDSEMASGGMMAKGGVTFKEKAASIKRSLLERKKVSPKVQKDYGKTYSPKEAEESARRIAGAMRKKEMMTK